MISLVFGTIVCVAYIVLFSLESYYVPHVSMVAAVILMVCFFVASRTLGKVLRARSPSERASRSDSASKKKTKSPPVTGHLQIIMSSAKWLGFGLGGHLMGAIISVSAPSHTVWHYVGGFFALFFLGFNVFAMTRYYRMAMLTRAARLASKKARADRRNKSAGSTASIVPEESSSATNGTQDGAEEKGEKAAPQQAWATAQ